MTLEKKPCLYCQTENEAKLINCRHCGMALAKKHPENKRNKLIWFSKVFWLITLFCLVMIIYLPR